MLPEEPLFLFYPLSLLANFALFSQWLIVKRPMKGFLSGHRQVLLTPPHLASTLAIL